MKLYEFAVPIRELVKYLEEHRHILHLNKEQILEIMNDLHSVTKCYSADLDRK